MNQQPECSTTVLDQNKPAARGWLRNGNPPGDFHHCARCGAKTRSGRPCRSPAMKNGRCRMHGGKSTGPRTEAGLERCRQANRKTGRHSKVQTEYRRIVREITRCLSITGAIVRAKTNEVSAPDSGQRDVGTSKIIEKAEHLLHHVWASEAFLWFARKHARGLYREYRSYCRMVDHPLPSRSRPPGQSPVEGRDRTALLVDLLCGYVEVMSEAMSTIIPQRESRFKRDGLTRPERSDPA